VLAVLLTAPLVEQVTKQTAPPSNGDAGGKTSPANGSAKPVALPPGVRTLLEFVAWVVYTRESNGLNRQLTGWLRGHGGYLSDTLPAVNEAAIRVQVWVKRNRSITDCGFSLSHLRPNRSIERRAGRDA